MSARAGTDVSWEGRGTFIFYVDLVGDLAGHALLLGHYVHLWVLRGMGFHVLDFTMFFDMRALASALYNRIK